MALMPNPIETKSERREIAPWLIAVAVFASLAAAVVRLHYAENSEESFWVALAYRFATGGRPFLDELNVAQAASIVLAGPIWLYSRLVPSLEGIFWFERVFTLLVSLGTAVLIFRSLRSSVNRYAAILFALPVTIFKVVGWPHWAHTTSGLFCFCLGVVLNLGATGAGAAGYSAWFSGALHTLAAILYLPFSAAGVPSFLAGILYAPSRKRYVAQFVGGAACAALLFGLVSGATPQLISEVLKFNANFGYNSPPIRYGLMQIAGIFLNKLPHRYLLVPGLGVLLLVWKRYPTYFSWAAVALPLLLFVAMPVSPSPCLDYFFAWYCLAPVFYWMSAERQLARRWMLVGWLPAGFAGVAVVLLSHAGRLMSGTGFFAGSFVTSLLLYRQLTVSAPKQDESRALVPFFLLVVLQSALYLNWPVLSQSDFVVNQSGPWKGIKTSSEYHKRDEDYRREVAGLVHGGERLAAFPDWNDAYLLPGAVPNVNFMWGCRLNSRAFAFCLNSQSEFMRASDLLVLALPSPSASEAERANWEKTHELMQSTHQLAVQNGRFFIFRRR